MHAGNPIFSRAAVFRFLLGILYPACVFVVGDSSVIELFLDLEKWIKAPFYLVDLFVEPDDAVTPKPTYFRDVRHY